MSDYLGFKGFCSRCQYSVKSNKYVMCSNRKSSFFGKPVNSIRCAPCFIEGEEKRKADLVSLIEIMNAMVGFGATMNSLNTILTNSNIESIGDLELKLENEVANLVK